MDPDATVALIVESLEALQGNAGDVESREELVTSLRDLAGWFEDGGFPPRAKLKAEA